MLGVSQNWVCINSMQQLQNIFAGQNTIRIYVKQHDVADLTAFGAYDAVDVAKWLHVPSRTLAFHLPA
jgi:hypothetical protein